MFKQQSEFQEVWITHSARYGNMLFLDLEESKFTLAPIPCVDNSKHHLLNTSLIWTPLIVNVNKDSVHLLVS